MGEKWGRLTLALGNITPNYNWKPITTTPVKRGGFAKKLAQPRAPLVTPPKTMATAFIGRPPITPAEQARMTAAAAVSPANNKRFATRGPITPANPYAEVSASGKGTWNQELRTPFTDALNAGISEGLGRVKTSLAGAGKMVAESTPSIKGSILPQSPELSAKMDELIVSTEAWVKQYQPESMTTFQMLAKDLTSGAVSIFSSIGIGLLTGGASGSAVLFGLMQAGDKYVEERRAGLSPERAGGIATAQGFVEAALEFIGLDSFLKLRNGIAWNTILRAGTEAVQEASQTFGENLLDMVWDKDQTLQEGVGRSALIGGLLGLPAAVSVSAYEQSSEYAEAVNRVSALGPEYEGRAEPIVSGIVRTVMESAIPVIKSETDAAKQKLALPSGRLLALSPGVGNAIAPNYGTIPMGGAIPRAQTMEGNPSQQLALPQEAEINLANPEEQANIAPDKVSSSAMAFLGKNPENVGVVGMDAKGIAYIFIAGQREAIKPEPGKWRINIGAEFFAISPAGRRALIENVLPQFTPEALAKAQEMPEVDGQDIPRLEIDKMVGGPIEEPPVNPEEVQGAVETDGEDLDAEEIAPNLRPEGDNWDAQDWRGNTPKEIIAFAREAVDKGFYNHQVYLNMFDALMDNPDGQNAGQAIRLLNEINDNVPPEVRLKTHGITPDSSDAKRWAEFPPNGIITAARRYIEEKKLTDEIYHAMRLALVRKLFAPKEGEAPNHSTVARDAIHALDKMWKEYVTPWGTPASLMPEKEIIPHGLDRPIVNAGEGFVGDGIRYQREDGAIYHYNEAGYRVWDRTRNVQHKDGLDVGFLIGDVLKTLDNGEADFGDIKNHEFTALNNMPPAKGTPDVRVVCAITGPEGIVYGYASRAEIVYNRFRDIPALIEGAKEDGYDRDRLAEIIDRREGIKVIVPENPPAPAALPAKKALGEGKGEPFDRYGLPKGVGYPLEKNIGKGKHMRKPHMVPFNEYVDRWVDAPAAPLVHGNDRRHAILLDNGEIFVDQDVQFTPKVGRGWRYNRPAYYVKLAQKNGIPYGRIARVGFFEDGKFTRDWRDYGAMIGNLGRKRTIWRYLTLLDKARNKGIILPMDVVDSMERLMEPINLYIARKKEFGATKTIRDWVNDWREVVAPWRGDWASTYQPRNATEMAPPPPTTPPPAQKAPMSPITSIGAGGDAKQYVAENWGMGPLGIQMYDPGLIVQLHEDNGDPLKENDKRFLPTDTPRNGIDGQQREAFGYLSNAVNKSGREAWIGGVPPGFMPFKMYLEKETLPENFDIKKAQKIKGKPTSPGHRLGNRVVVNIFGGEMYGYMNHTSLMNEFELPSWTIAFGSHIYTGGQSIVEWAKTHSTGATVWAAKGRYLEAQRWAGIVKHTKQLIERHPEWGLTMPADVLSDLKLIEERLKRDNGLLPDFALVDGNKKGVTLDNESGDVKFKAFQEYDVKDKEGNIIGHVAPVGREQAEADGLTGRKLKECVKINQHQVELWKNWDVVSTWEGLSERKEPIPIAQGKGREGTEAKDPRMIGWEMKDIAIRGFINQLRIAHDIHNLYRFQGAVAKAQHRAADQNIQEIQAIAEDVYPLIEEVRGLPMFASAKHEEEALHRQLAEDDLVRDNPVPQDDIEGLLGKINDPHFNGGRPGFMLLRLLNPEFLTAHSQVGLDAEQTRVGRIHEAALDDVYNVRDLMFFNNGNENILCLRGAAILAVNAVNDGRALFPNIKTGQIYAPGNILPFYAIGDKLRAAGKTFADLDKFAAIYVAGLGFPINRADMPEINEAMQKDMQTVMQNAALLLGKYTDEEQRVFMQAMDATRAYIVPLVTAMVNKGMIDTKGLSVDAFIDRYMCGSPAGIPDIQNGDPLMTRDIENVSKEKVIGFMDGIANAMVHLYKAYYENEFVQDFAEKLSLVSDTKSSISFYNDKGEQKFVKAPEYILRQLNAIFRRNGPEAKLLTTNWYRKAMYYSRQAKIFTPNFAMVNLPRDATLAFAHYGVHPITLIQTAVGVIAGKSNKAAGQMYLGLGDLDSVVPKTTLKRILEYLKDNVLGVSESLMRNYSKNVAQDLGGSERDMFYALLGGTTDFTVHGSSGKVMNVEALLQFAKAGLNVAQSWNNQFREMLGDFDDPNPKVRLNAYNRALYLIIFMVAAIIFKTRQKQKKILQDYIVDNKIPIEINGKILAIPEGWNTGMLLENEIATVIAGIKNGTPLWKIEREMGEELFSGLMGYIGRDGDLGIKSIIATLQPTMIEPIVRAILNVQYGGRPIDAFTYGQAYTHFYDSTSEVAKKVCARLHAKDPNSKLSPILLEYVLKSYLGRYGQAISVMDDAAQPGVFNGLKNAAAYFAKQPYFLAFPAGIQTQMYQEFKLDYAKINGDLTAINKGILKVNDAMYTDLLALQNVYKAIGQATDNTDIFALATIGESIYETYVKDAHDYNGK